MSCNKNRSNLKLNREIRMYNLHREFSTLSITATELYSAMFVAVHQTFGIYISIKYQIHPNKINSEVVCT